MTMMPMLTHSEFNSPPRSPKKKLFVVECRYIGEQSPWFEHSREWHRHAAYRTLRQAEQAAECLNKETKGKLMLMNGKVIPPRYEFRVSPVCKSFDGDVND